MRKRGYVASLHLEHAGDFLSGDFNYYEISAEGRYFISVANRAVVALRVRGGSIDGTGESEADSVPFYKRYFLGGATNLRGWGRFDVSPLTDGGNPIGGYSFTELLDRVARARSGATSAASCSSTAATSGRIRGISISTICATTSARAFATTRRSGRSAPTSAIS